MNSFYCASLTLEVVVRDRGSYNIYMTKIFQEVGLFFIKKYFHRYFTRLCNYLHGSCFEFLISSNLLG